MDEDPDGKDPERTEGTQQVTGWFSVKPEDDVSFTENDEGLEEGNNREDGVKQVLFNFTFDLLCLNLTQSFYFSINQKAE